MDVLTYANVVTSHVLYKVKTSEDRERKRKVRLVPHGNRDKKKDNIGKDSASAQFNIIRFGLSLATFINFRLATAHMQGAYLQSWPINGTVHVRPFVELSATL